MPSEAYLLDGSGKLSLRLLGGVNANPVISIRGNNATDGILINDNRLYYWDMYGRSLTGVELRNLDGLAFTILEFTTRQHNGSSYSNFSHWIPVPESQLETAWGIVRLFNSALGITVADDVPACFSSPLPQNN